MWEEKMKEGKFAASTFLKKKSGPFGCCTFGQSPF